MESVVPGRSPQKVVIVPVQFLRGMAASLVVTVHLLERLVKRGVFPQGLPDWVWSFGEMGIATFFAISGFIMIHTTAQDFGSPRSGARFFGRRLIRLAPIYYVTSAMMVMFSAATHGLSTKAAHVLPSLLAMVMSVLFIPYYNERGLLLPAYELGWTLDYEMLFYAIFAIAMALPWRAGIVAIIGCLVGLVAIGGFVGQPAAMIDRAAPAYFFTRPLLLYFIIGIGIGLARMAWGPRQTSLPDWLCCAMATLALLLGVRFGSRGIGAGCAVAVALAIAGLLDSGARLSTRFRSLSRAFGDSSYSLYLTHSFLLGAIAVASARIAARGPVSLAVLIGATCVVCASVAWVVWRYVEAPLTRWLLDKARLSSRQEIASQVAP